MGLPSYPIATRVADRTVEKIAPRREGLTAIREDKLPTMTSGALFISRAGADAAFAGVIGEILEAAGYTVSLQQWDFANRNFIERMHSVLAEDARVVALLSPEYLKSEHCQAEWQNAIADDPLNTKSRLILLRVVECEPIGLLRGLAYWDLVPIRDNRTLLEEIVREAVREDRRDAAPSGPYWRAPRTIIDSEAIRPVSSFSGRDDALADILSALENGTGVALLHGLGGVGKSSVAREYAWRNRDRYSVVWWLDAETEDGIIEGLLRLGSLFTRGLGQIADRRVAAQQVVGSILSAFAKPVLLVFDNLENERLLRTWQPRTGARVLATSRNASWSPDMTVVELDTWPLETAVGYLRRESGRNDLTEDDARAMAEALGSLPLALSHAAASLRAMRMITPERYLERIAEHLKRAPRDAEYPSSVFATFNAAIAQAEAQAPGAAAVLSFAAQFAPDGIPDELFRQPLELCPEGLKPVVAGNDAIDLRTAMADELRLDEALAALDRLALLTFAMSSRTYGMHRLVQLAARDLVSDAATAWHAFAVEAANSAFPEPEFGTSPQCERLIRHARAALDGLTNDVMLLAVANLAYRCSIYLWQRGEYAAAEPLCARALTIREALLEPDHLDIASTLNTLANIYDEEGRYAEAASLHERALAIREKALGPHDPAVGITLHNLAGDYSHQGRYAEAEALHKRALAIREQPGRDPRWVAYTLINLTSVYLEQGRYDEAEPLGKRALAIHESSLESDHPDLAWALNGLALTYAGQGRYDEAASLHTRALAIREERLGTDHPQVAQSLYNLAILYGRQKRHAEAEALLTRSLAIREEMLGVNHPCVAESLNELGRAYAGQGRYADAEPLHQRALSIQKAMLGPEHPDVATSLNLFALTYRDQGRYEDAQALISRALSIREKALGHGHPSTIAAREALSDRLDRSMPRRQSNKQSEHQP